jgi:hypothetical protein
MQFDGRVGGREEGEEKERRSGGLDEGEMRDTQHY